MDSARRLIQLWLIHGYLDLMFLLRNPRPLLLYTFGDAVMGLGSVASVILLSERFGGLGDWSRGEILFLGAYGMLLSGVMEMFFGYNIFFVSRRIGRGQLDHSLLQPRSLASALLTEGFVPFSGCGGLIAGLVMTTLAIATLNVTPEPIWYAWLVLQLFASAVVLLSFTAILGALAFWAPRGAEELNSSTARLFWTFRGFPLDRVAEPARTGLLTILPIGFTAWAPAKSLVTAVPTASAYLATPMAAAIFATIAIVVFRGGLRHYARTGSSRYSDFGHRR
ncbi:MAG: hypothetical protein EPO26_05915 [Chloroflexota bacterium]|nr:MAG: hypothetical protein EPO26_05915 [Chloroflexota bacterium]